MTETDDDSETAVPASELRDLAEQFRERSDEAMDLGMIQASDEIKECAVQLEEVLEESTVEC
ncbi:hypothetical protein [Halanaeroarchaeum sulfurireducens]|uniref:hypothetical protein n=1 Tax=Halanaeroarchaeum sulfurireducens TaxID=1604004 RepID=UPI0006792D56|nr:hypothetical protein [Halanaeroarchaeum sulfurireducens]